MEYRKRYAADSPYAVLGLEYGASLEEVKKAFRRLAKEMHPDVAEKSDDSEVEGIDERFVKLNAAYELLSNEDTKRVYDDQHREHPWTASKSWRKYLEKL